MCIANQLTGFYMRATLALNGFTGNGNRIRRWLENFAKTELAALPNVLIKK